MCHRLKLLCPLSLSFLAYHHHCSHSFTGIFDRVLSFDSAPSPFQGLKYRDRMLVIDF